MMVTVSEQTLARPPKESKTFGAYSESSREARRFAGDWLQRMDLELFAERVVLAVSELATNAVLHAVAPFTIRLQAIGGGVRLEAIDSAADRTPVAVPRTGSAVDLIEISETGRGLLIVGAVANRWGVTLDSLVKTVWCEFDAAGDPAPPSEPIIEDHRPVPTHAEGINHLRFIGLPVRSAIASGLNVEDAIRQLQLSPRSATEAVTQETTNLIALVERTVAVRLAGRHAAMQAAGQNRTHFDFDLDASDDELLATGELSIELERRRSAAPSAEVIAFRAWLSQETLRQRRGEPPSAYPTD